MDIRTLVLGLGVFCATFLLGWWLNIGNVLYRSGASQPVAAVEGPTTTGQGQSQAQPAQRFIAHVPVLVSGGSQSQSPQPKAPAAAKLPQVKYAQTPKAKTASSSSSSKPAVRVRRR